jgi:cobalt-zinc-cadmium efflux system outer membrane protein
MKKYTILIISILLFNSNLFSQNYIDEILSDVEKNNTTLSALRKTAEADKIENKTGIFLQNPEIEFAYLWGSPAVIGNRTDFSIIQSFDFPSVYKYQNQIANIKNEQVELEYHKQLKNILLKTQLVCSDLIYANAMKSELSKRLIQAQSIEGAYKSKFDIGETNILEFNKAQLNVLNIRSELDRIDIERNVLLSELTLLNGGIYIDFTEMEFQTQILTSDFEKWYINAEQNNPVLNWLKQEIELSQKKEDLNKALTYPKLQAGYLSEKVIGQQFQGITVGFSIPIWENKNTVKFAKANSIAIESIAADNKVQFYNQLKALHAKAISLQKSANDYRQSLRQFDNSKLLKKALEKGEINLIDYILELSIYYESVDNLLMLDKEIYKTIAELNQFL